MDSARDKAARAMAGAGDVEKTEKVLSLSFAAAWGADYTDELYRGVAFTG